MKKTLLVILLFFSANFIFSQEFENLCDAIKKSTTAEELDAMECEIFLAVGYILSQPYKDNKLDDSYALESLDRWMKGTENYHLITGGKILEDCDRDDDTMKSIYKVCMIEFLFANHEYVHKASDNEIRYVNIHKVREIIFGGAQLFMDYLSKQNKKIINKKLYKGLKLYKEGRLKEYMDS